MQNDELNTASKRGTVFYALGYALLYLMAWISTNSTMLSTVFRIAPTSGLALHRTLLRTIMHAPLLYFSTADTGVLLNYFSQDIQLVDKTLESAVMAFATQVFKMIMQASATCCAAHHNRHPSHLCRYRLRDPEGLPMHFTPASTPRAGESGGYELVSSGNRAGY